MTTSSPEFMLEVLKVNAFKGCPLFTDYEEKVKKESSVLEQAFSACYFVMKEHLPNTKFIPLLEMIEKQIGVSELKYFAHRSKGSIHILICLGKAVKQMLLEDMKRANSFGLLIDEATDIATLSQLLCFIQYVTLSGCPEVQFLAIRNLLDEFDLCNAEAIVETVLKVFEESDLDVSELSGLATDGASVMLGKNNGVAAKLKERNPKLINIHCICHKLALACVDTVSELTYIKLIETTLRQLWQWLENLPKRMAAFLKVQVNLKRAKNVTDKATKVIARRLKKACSSCWLSFDKSVFAVKQEFESLLQTLNMFQDRDAAACGFVQKMKQVKFLGTIYILAEVLPKLSNLSKAFQAGKFNFSAILPAVAHTKSQFEAIKAESAAMDALEKDIDGIGFIATEVKMSRKDANELVSRASTLTA